MEKKITLSQYHTYQYVFPFCFFLSMFSFSKEHFDFFHITLNHLVLRYSNF